MANRTQKTAASFVNDSGFPLQVAVEHAVRNSSSGWKVHAVEQAWSNKETGESGFIDLVIEKQNVFLVIECKRTRDTTWAFLLPDKKQLSRRYVKGWASVEESSATGHFPHFGWSDLIIDPRSPQSSFCAMRGQEPHVRSLERIASGLVSATEGFALEHVHVRAHGSGVPIRRFYFSVIVTTSPLGMCEFDPLQIDLANGTIENPTVEAIPLVRLHKQLAVSSLGIRAEPSFNDYGRENEHTVLVVNSAHLLSLLDDFELDPSCLTQFMKD